MMPLTLERDVAATANMYIYRLRPHHGNLMLLIIKHTLTFGDLKVHGQHKVVSLNPTRKNFL